MASLRARYHQEVITTHTRKILRLLNNQIDLVEHVLNISSYELSFFQKLVLCRGLKFALLQPVSPIKMKASFEKAYWSLERSLSDEKIKELAATALRSATLNYIQRNSPRPPKALLVAIEAITLLSLNQTTGQV